MTRSEHCGGKVCQGNFGLDCRGGGGLTSVKSMMKIKEERRKGDTPCNFPIFLLSLLFPFTIARSLCLNLKIPNDQYMKTKIIQSLHDITSYSEKKQV